MTVKCITKTQKAIIAQQYCFIKVPVKSLAQDYQVSTRTIHRVLVEQGVAPVRRSRKVIINQPVEIIQPVSLTFKQKVIKALKAFFSKLNGQ